MKRREFISGLTFTALNLVFANNNHVYAIGKSIYKNQKFGIVPRARLGINFAAITYWGSEFPFKDLFKVSGEWVSNEDGQKWGSGPSLELDSNGWIKRLNPNCFATKMIALPRMYKTGLYHIVFDGDGDVAISFNSGRTRKKTVGKVSVYIQSTNNPLAINIRTINPKNPIRNIRIFYQNENEIDGSFYTKRFIDTWTGVSCIRLMDFMATNNSTIKQWSDRPKVDDASYSKRGVPLELMVELANKLNAEPWFCIPHLADDDYVRNFIYYVEKNLNPNLRAWIEYSNEVWNSVFDQAKHSIKIGLQSFPTETSRDAGLLAYAKRSRDIFKTINSVVLDGNRFVRVVSSQAANPYVADKILSFQDLASYTDVLAIAPYFSFNVEPNADLNDKVVANWDLDKLFNYLETYKLPEAKEWVENNKKISNKYGISLVAYEAGQHLTGYRGAENNSQLIELFANANKDPRMGQLYSRYLKDWQSSGGDLLCAFNSTSPWGKWGSWGLLQNATENQSKSPKFKAVVEWAQANGQPLTL